MAGVSRQSGQAANAVFRKLRDAGYEVFPINPRAAEVEGVTCYSSVGAVPGQLDGVVIATAPEVSVQIVRDCSVPPRISSVAPSLLWPTAACPRRPSGNAMRAGSTASLEDAR